MSREGEIFVFLPAERLGAGEVVTLPGGRQATVSHVEDAGYRGMTDRPVVNVMYSEFPDDWSRGNSTVGTNLHETVRAGRHAAGTTLCDGQCGAPVCVSRDVAAGRVRVHYRAGELSTRRADAIARRAPAAVSWRGSNFPLSPARWPGLVLLAGRPAVVADAGDVVYVRTYAVAA